MNFWNQLTYPIIGLSPMDGVTDATFRHIVATHGHPDIVFTEFTSVGEICHSRKGGWGAFQYSQEERPILAQLYGKDPELFYQAAHIVCEMGFDGLDINMGCPSKNVAASGSGAALIKTPERAIKIMEAAHQGIDDWANGQSLREAGVRPMIVEKVREMNIENGWTPSLISNRMPIPLSVKTRLGYDEVVIEEWSECLTQGRPVAISIHGRTLQQMYRGQADWEAIGLAAQRLRGTGIRILGNGDIRSLVEALTAIKTYGVDGILIGRAALGNPWIFRRIHDLRRAIDSGTALDVIQDTVDLPTRFQMILDHAAYYETRNPKEDFPRMRKHLGWYCSGFPHAAAMRASMVRTSSVHDVAQILRDYQATHLAGPAHPHPAESLT
ncbi:MAG: tRNA-dihydrouridine synthase [Nitrospirales bacterium]|nr:MAG: tRNA-dihydrouridine synthase [Nitrospirales bacterium]